MTPGWSPFLTSSGRVRIGWRLAGFFGVVLLVGSGVGAVVPPGLVGGAFALLAGALVAGSLLLSLDGRTPGALGFYISQDSMTEAVRGTAFGALIGMMVVGGIALFGGMSWVSQSGTAGEWFVGAAAGLAWFAIPAAAEEALLRGYPLQVLTEAYGPLVGVGMTSVAFGAMHLANPGTGVLEVVNVTAAGLLFGVVYVKTLSLWWVTAIHLGWNWAHGYLADVSVSGLDVVDAPLYDGLGVGEEWLSGGAFGPEGSVVTTVVLLSVTAWVWCSQRWKPGQAALASGSLLTTELDMNEGKD